MNRWTGGFGFLLGIASLVYSNVGHCQDLKPKFRLESTAGLVIYHADLLFETSPSFGLGAGLDFSRMLQLNLFLSLNPTHQRISQAASDTEVTFTIYEYVLSLEIMPKKLAYKRIQLFAGLQAGGLVIDAKPVALDIGAGQSRLIDPSTDHLWTIGLRGGMLITMTRNLALRLGLKHRKHRLGKEGPGGRWKQSTVFSTGIAIAF